MSSESIGMAVQPVSQTPRDAVSITEAPACVIRVGVTGHRPSKLPQDQIPHIREAVREILKLTRTTTEEIAKSKQSYSSQAPVFRIVSSLAEGSDRLVAEEGLALEFSLECPLPAHRDEYRPDFKEQSSAETFDQLLCQAKAVFELDGQRSGEWLETAAYEAAGRMVLSHSDVLITIWDGKRGEPAGTGQMVGEARQVGIPIVRIDPQDPARIEFLSPTTLPASDWRDELRNALTTALLPPSSAQTCVKEFLTECVAFQPAGDPIVDHRDRADQIAGRYAKLYRRAYLTMYSLAPLSVLCAIVGWWLVSNIPETSLEWLLTALELLLIVIILVVIWRGRKGRWHEHWLDARVLAEQFRTWAFLAPIGQTPPTSRLPPYVSKKASQGDWTGWYFRARVRERGLSSDKVTPEYLEDYRRLLLQVLDEQARHHSEKGEGRKRIHERIEFATTALFGLTAVACFVHLVWPQLFQAESIAFLTTLAAVTAALPAFGAALEGLQAQGEYQRLSERAEGMHHYFRSIQNRLTTAKPSYTILADFARQASAVMLDELSDWRNLERIRILHWV
jgi:hypothetical protein